MSAPEGAVARPPVVVLFGGRSAEHDVSVVSGTDVAQALVEAGLATEQVLIDLAGDWWWLPSDHRRAGRRAAEYDEPVALGADGPLGPGTVLERLATRVPRPVVFIALHGPYGEDGAIQGLLETAGLCHTGAGVAASALGMDKALFKRLARGVGLPVPDWLEVPARRWLADRVAVLAELEAFADAGGDERLMVKPARLGSSVGMTLAHAAAERGPAIDLALRYDTLAIVERYVARSRELEVAVLGNDPSRLEVYGPGEILSGREFYDYAAKYTPGLSETAVHAELDAAIAASTRTMAAEAYRAIGAEGFARVDFLAAPDGTVYVSEINTIPGFTPISLFPALPAEAGLSYADVCLRVVDLALERCRERQRPDLTSADLYR
jgi:D-alanine-D-alanine ligase